MARYDELRKQLDERLRGEHATVYAAELFLHLIETVPAATLAKAMQRAEAKTQATIAPAGEPTPTPERPGSREKIAVLQERASRGEELHAPDDYRIEPVRVRTHSVMRTGRVLRGVRGDD